MEWDFLWNKAASKKEIALTNETTPDVEKEEKELSSGAFDPNFILGKLSAQIDQLKINDCKQNAKIEKLESIVNSYKNWVRYFSGAMAAIMFLFGLLWKYPLILNKVADRASDTVIELKESEQLK